ncbi:MAG: glycosyltransferase [Bacteroidales bacterium]|nr:glycosyltransferase [Bacteroidales bacterium]
MKKVLISVTNDLVTDQRVNKVCLTLLEMGFEVKLVGRKKKDSLSIQKRAYQTKRMRLLWTKGPLFYAGFNIRLFCLLLVTKFDLLVANDLDTLLANYLAHKIKRKPIVYDSHEYYTETPEVINRKFVRNTWLSIEKWIFPKLKDVITVSDSIASEYSKKYNIPVKVIRNLPLKLKRTSGRNRNNLNLPDDKKILILQGSGINIQRGAEELVEAMQFLDGYLLLIVGGGDVIKILKEKSSELQLSDKIKFTGKVPFSELVDYTTNADLGITIDKDICLNYRYSLPNKIFDYIQAGIPVLASELVEVRKIIRQYDIGDFIQNHEPIHIADSIRRIFSDPVQLGTWKKNTKKAAEELCWENEKIKLLEIYGKYV